MRLKEIESYLSNCDTFKMPKIHLEQYATSSHIASRMIYSAQEYIEDSLVCDIGSGCGILSIGSSMAGAKMVTGFEIDQDAIQIALSNKSEIFEEDEAGGIDFILAEMSPLNLQNSFSKFKSLYDVVIMNPPFGTKNNAGADFNFLKCASTLVRPGGHIYSLHKTLTRPFFLKKLKECSKGVEAEVQSEDNDDLLNLNLKGQVLAEVVFDIPKSYKFHKEKSVDIAVDFWHFEKLEL